MAKICSTSLSCPSIDRSQDVVSPGGVSTGGRWRRWSPPVASPAVVPAGGVSTGGSESEVAPVAEVAFVAAAETCSDMAPVAAESCSEVCWPTVEVAPVAEVGPVAAAGVPIVEILHREVRMALLGQCLHGNPFYSNSPP